ncbi:MAG TPA: [protein-PII] uridylyltransferase [Acidimicrobiales bacterium]|nr:[protein-PII] uridylyltransferase [Acidimicrobiales bacterium]
MGDVALRDRRQRLVDQADLHGTDFCRAYAGSADEWLREVADRATGGSHRHLALVAVGGYGRGALCPFSDLDVVLVHDGRRDVKSVAQAIWYPVWDQGVHLDHSVRRPKEVLAAAASDLRVALGLLDARLVWGDPRVAEPLLGEALDLWRRQLGPRWLPALAEQMAERRRVHGDVAFLLEPDLKEGHGGLRDVNVLRALAVCAPQLAEAVDLASLEPAATVLTEVRVELHRSAGRALDRLLLQEQDHIASVLSYADADALMAAVAEAGRRIAWVTEGAWRRRRLWEPAAAARRRGRWQRRPGKPVGPGEPVERVGPGGPVGPAGSAGTAASPAPREVEPGIMVLDGEVGLGPGAALADDPSLPLRVAAVAAERDLPIAREALELLAAHAPSPPEPWPAALRQALVRVLAAGHAAVDALEALDQESLLVRFIPEWATVRNRPQRNAYHRYTVDRHLLEAAANAADRACDVARPDLLLVGTLLHDIGKGSPGDHTAAGMAMVATIAARMGYADDDVSTLVALVRHHLLLADVATRRDLDDPATITTVAGAVGDAATLSLLAALTEADSRATGSSAWGSWKAGLVADLVERTTRQLQGTAPVAGGVDTAEHRHLVAEVRGGRAPVVVVDPPQVLVAAPDRRGLLATVAGVLALHGLDVRSADVRGEDGVAVEVFRVEIARGTWPDSERVRADLQAALAGRLHLDHHLAQKADAYAPSRRPMSARPVVPSVDADNAASATSTVVEVRAPDELGLLHRVTRALFDSGLDVVSARVSTLGDEVVDAFYVRDSTGAKVTDTDRLAALRRAVLAAIEQ